MDLKFRLNDKKNIATFNFNRVEERDNFLNFFFPERVGLDTPGFYKIANGDLGVSSNTVTVYRNH
jgi:hypothetical protein